MAVLTSTGITFSDATTLASKYGIIPQNTIALLRGDTTPVGWTKIVSQDNKALRIVSGTGGGTGGTTAFTTVHSDSLAVPGSTGPTSLDITQIASHNHITSNIVSNIAPNNTGNFPGGLPTKKFRTVTTSPQGGSGGHSHPVTAGTFSFEVAYIDTQLCQFS